LIAQSSSFTEEQLELGALQITTSLKHKYAEDVPVKIKVELGGAPASPKCSMVDRLFHQCHGDLLVAVSGGCLVPYALPVAPYMLERSDPNYPLVSAYHFAVCLLAQGMHHREVDINLLDACV